MNNLKQMALACHGHLSAWGYFPMAGWWGGSPATFTANGTPYVGPNQQCGWTYQILPYMNQIALWAKYSPNGTTEAAIDLQRMATAVPQYNCPSVKGVRIILDTDANPPVRSAMSDYASNAGTSLAGGDNCGTIGNGFDSPIPRQPSTSPTVPYTWGGVTYPVTPSLIPKGLATTLLLGEKCLSMDKLLVAQADDDNGWYTGFDTDSSRWGNMQPMPNYHDVTEYAGQGINYGAPESQSDIYTVWRCSFGSAHPGSSNYALCDGSVRPITYNIALLTFQYLSTRDVRVSDPTVQPALIKMPPVGAGAF
jgi:prepilin-type processing-associated H-X9-DG protein